MPPTSISLLKRKLYKHLWFFRPLLYVLAIVFAIGLLFLIIPKLKPLLLVPSFLNPSITNLDTSKNRTNILLLGIGGGEHSGANLTDSIMLISINLTSADTVLISLPRDIWVESLSAKLNAAYAFGENKQPGSGLILAKSAVSEILNQPVHYAAVLDFSGFKEAIDVIGGIDLNIPHGFTDPQYPVPGKETALPETDRYEVLTFVAGQQHLDGDTALKYVRSRQAEGEEGTDYARAQRQQRVVLAFKDELLSPTNFLNLRKISALKKILQNSVETDLPSASLPDLAKLAAKIDQSQIRTGIIDQGSDSEDIPSLLYNPPISLYGQWVLLPVNNDWQPIYKHVEAIIYQNQSSL